MLSITNTVKYCILNKNPNFKEPTHSGRFFYALKINSE
jgi:hypothetical protein